VRWVLGLLVLATLGVAIFHTGTTQSAQVLPISPEDITGWLYDHIVKPIEDFLSWLGGQIIRVLQVPFDIIYSAFSAFGDAVRTVFDSINRALSEAFREFFWG